MTKFEMEMQNIRTGIANMSIMVNEMFRDAVEALKDNNLELAQSVILKDKKVDMLDIQVDEMCLKMLALYSPKAIELRYLVAVLRIIIDLERAGDHSKIIAKQVKKHYFGPIIAKLPEFGKITELTLALLNKAADGFFESKPEIFAETLEADKRVGELQSQLNKTLIAMINAEPVSAKAAVSLINIIRRVERIADHAKNIAEMVPYVVTGEIMRHREIYHETDL